MRYRAARTARRLLPSADGPGRVLRGMDRLERWSGADRLIDRIRAAVRALPLGAGRDALHGRWLGHPVHPLMVQMPIGMWLSAALLDLLPGRRRGARTLVGAGLAGAGPAALAGWVDWAELPKQQQRVGLVHATANVTGVALYTASYAARRRGRDRRGKALGFAGLAVVFAGGALGGHLAYRQASGANHAEHVPHLVEPGWHAVGETGEFPVGRPVRRQVGEVAVMVVREETGAFHVLADRCSHMAGPLSEGEIEDGCVRCPWHGSVFRLADGWNVRGPATAPQPSFDSRVVGDRLEVRLRHLAGTGDGSGAAA
ncbi:Rieske 2Fe-2S domain-containing protein [Streptomyces sudanensis]|uniref:Rieske 2Fe-2S domain-containing protein n=1 Tax=Streptomyces sudanensis TaxID=436397 RepID=UPI0020CC95B3|nr:Rieske (2Fe-2S) protein [Streptomyces sudanensis]MCP9956354.1 Rieske (2Fe-2S) protein [Streptomyces sudanensis]MCP9985560.1 Rieske (2Fe-2S) protein [Streptomyces sudanensis]MCQ0003029.1 Rieske (2Fe-2S) protein [Streptomyces sudanensis]